FLCSARITYFARISLICDGTGCSQSACGHHASAGKPAFCTDLYRRFHHSGCLVLGAPLVSVGRRAVLLSLALSSSLFTIAKLDGGCVNRVLFKYRLWSVSQTVWGSIVWDEPCFAILRFPIRLWPDSDWMSASYLGETDSRR